MEEPTTPAPSTRRRKMNLQVRFKSEPTTIEHNPEPITPPEHPSKRQKLPAKPADEVFEYNPGQLSSLYPWYYGPPVQKLQPASRAKPRQPSQRTTRSSGRTKRKLADSTHEDHDADGATVCEDDAMALEEDPFADIKFRRLPVGLKLEDIQDVHERDNFKNRMEVASSTALLAKGLDAEQLMWFLNEVKEGPIAGYIDWNRFERAGVETKVAFGVEDGIRDAYINSIPDYPLNAYNTDEAVPAYDVMENIYLSAANTRGDVKSYSSMTPEEQNKMKWHRKLYHDIRAKIIIEAIEKVEFKLKSSIPRRYRTIKTLRRAFDYLCNLHHPTFPWPCSHAYFEATLDMIHVNEYYCMLVFEEHTGTFLEMLRAAMVDAEKRRMKDWIEARSDEEFFDLLGTGMAPNFEDQLLAAPNPYSSATEVVDLSN